MSERAMLPVGRTWLLAADSQGRGSIWALALENGPWVDAGFKARARDAAWEAHELARWFALTSRPASELTVPPGGTFVWWDGPANTRDPSVSLEGASFGLALLLASVSRRLGLALPPDLACTGVVGPDGALRGVGGLRGKIGALASFAERPRRFPAPACGPVAIHRLLVPSSSAREAVSHRTERGFVDLEVIGVDSVTRAAEVAFGAAELRSAQIRACGGEEDRVAGRLFELALADAPGFLPWETIAGIAVAIERGATTDSARREARVAGAIAGRHAEQPRGLPAGAWEWLADYPRAVALRLVAHIVQGSADSCDPDWEGVSRRAQVAVGSGEPCDGTARVLGALGRLHGAWMRYDDAAAILRHAVCAWRSLRSGENASYAVCEWLRIAGFLQGGALAPALEAARECLDHPKLPPHSADYVRLALVRARSASGSNDEARTWIRQMAPHSRLHRNALRHLAIGGDSGALGALREGGRDVDLVLAELGLGVGDAGGLLAELKQMRRCAPDVGRLLHLLGPSAPHGDVARHWRY